MWSLNTIKKICIALSLLSCSSSNTKSEKIIRYDGSLIAFKANKNVSIILLNDFNDSLQIKLGNKIISKDFFKTNETTGSCKKRVKLTFDSSQVSDIFFYNNKNQMLYKVHLIKIKKYLYVWKQDNIWSHELTDTVKELE